MVRFGCLLAVTSVAMTSPVSAADQETVTQWQTEESRNHAGYAQCRLIQTNGEGDKIILHFVPELDHVSLMFVEAKPALMLQDKQFQGELRVSASNEIVRRDVDAYREGESGIRFVVPVENHEKEGLFTALAASKTVNFGWKNFLGGSQIGQVTIPIGDMIPALNWVPKCIERSGQVTRRK